MIGGADGEYYLQAGTIILPGPFPFSISLPLQPLYVTTTSILTVQVGAEVESDWVTEDGFTDRLNNRLRWALESQFDSHTWPNLPPKSMATEVGRSSHECC